MTTIATALTGLDGGQITLTKRGLGHLRSRAGGRVLRPGDPGWEQAFRSGPVQLVNRPHGTLLTAANECSGHAGQTALAVRLPGWHALRSILRPTCTDVWVSRCALTSILRRIPSERESNTPPHLRLALVFMVSLLAFGTLLARRGIG